MTIFEATKEQMKNYVKNMTMDELLAESKKSEQAAKQMQQKLVKLVEYTTELSAAACELVKKEMEKNDTSSDLSFDITRN